MNKKEEKKIEKLNGMVSRMNERIEELENKIDHQEQYPRRNCILKHGIAENKEENTDEQAIDFINDNLDIKINDIDIDRSHRYLVRNWKLKGTGKSIAKSLARERIGQLNDVRKKYGFNNVLSYDEESYTE